MTSFCGGRVPPGSRLVLILIALLYVGVAGAPVIFDDNEGLYADAVREMRARHDWLVPMSNGFPRVQKPPLVYWAMLASTAVLGENEFALRLPNALATVGWIFGTYFIARRIGGEAFGVASAAALASMLGVWIFTHLVQPEPFLACFITLAFGCLVEARFSPASQRGLGSAFWIFLALGTMSKGLHGTLWPLGTAGLLAFFVPSTRPWLRLIAQGRGVFVYLVIAVPWYAFMAAKWPHFLAYHFLNEQAGAALNARYPADARQLPLVQFYAQHLLFWLPWTLLLPGALVAIDRARKRPGQVVAASAPEGDAVKLLTVWVAATLVTVAFSLRQDYYTLTCWGVVGMFLVFPWTARQAADFRPARPFLAVPALLLAGTGALALGVALFLRASTAAIEAAPIAQRDTFMDALTGISPTLWALLRPLLALVGATLLLAGSAAAVCAWRYKNQTALLLLAASMALPVVPATRGFAIMSPYFSLAASARAIEADMPAHPGALAACEGAPNTASSLLYYLSARVHWVNAPFDNQYAQCVLDEGHDYYWDEAALRAAWSGPAPIYFVVEEERLAHWRAQLFPAPRVVIRDGTRYVLCNR